MYWFSLDLLSAISHSVYLLVICLFPWQGVVCLMRTIIFYLVIDVVLVSILPLSFFFNYISLFIFCLPVKKFWMFWTFTLVYLLMLQLESLCLWDDSSCLINSTMQLITIITVLVNNLIFFVGISYYLIFDYVIFIQLK